MNATCKNFPDMSNYFNGMVTTNFIWKNVALLILRILTARNSETIILLDSNCLDFL